ncbi:hypothetical protein AVEN_138649-1 [Araneus ventricosus]|uniref:Uncharacterized protein n=1 Tax=Araneus ventricosus TaxID=182803 RepID=A0A4Y2E5V2_ARAVE|nr:hypothetical protein AVEN_138649-1 [Araneus ventricosus]
MASRRRHTPGLLQLLVTLFLLCDARSSKYCEYSSFVSDIVLESCVRRELATKVNGNYRTKGSTSQLTEYTDIWAKCFEAARSSSCNAAKQYNLGVLDLKMHILNVWSELDELLDSTRNKDNPDDELCLENFKHSVRTCLPIIKAYAFGLGKGDLKVLRHFMECVSMEIKSCDDTTRKILLEVMEKNVLGRVLVSGDSMEYLKECLEVFDEKKLERCAPGLSNFLLKVTYEDLIISVESIILSNNSCILEALKECDTESLQVIAELVQNFLNITLFKPAEISFRQVKMENFFLMPDDREEIRVCLGSSLESEVNACVPGLFNLLESIAKGEPQGHSLLRSVHQRTACLGIAFRRCPGSTRFIMRKTIQALYGTTLDIPFDRNSILSRPGQYETHILEILFPHYTISDNVARTIRDCLEKTVCKLGNCCGQLSDAMVNVLLNKSLPFPISQKSDCIEPCYSAVFNECSEEGASQTARLLYSVKLAYNKLEVLGITHLPMKPPYKLPVEIFESISLCLEYVDPTTLENCCPGIIDIIHAYVRNRPIPFKFVAPRSCKYECVLYATSVCDITSASHLQSFIALAIKMYESIPSTSALVQQEDNNFGIERVNNKINIPQNYIGLIATCINNISTQLNSCCPTLSSAIHDVLNNKSVDNCKEDLKWCTKFCYEPVFLQCRKPEIMLQLARTVLDVANYTWDDVLFIVVFPPEPPYRLPRDVIAGVNLCLKMVENLERCCPLLSTALRTVVEDRPWISQKFNLMPCEPSCYKYELNQCPAESRDITLGLIIGLIHFNEISVSIYNCLQIIKAEFTRCCPGTIDILFYIFMGNEHCKSPDQFEKKCDILCTMKSLRKCEVIAADIVQKVMKYVFEYEPICLDERNTLAVVNKKYPKIEEKDGNKGDWIEEKKKTTDNFLVTTLSSEYVSETAENFGKRIQNNDREEILGDEQENNSTPKFRRTDNSRRFVESYDQKSTQVTESSYEKQSDSQYSTTSNIKLFTGLEFGEEKSSSEGSYLGYSTEERDIADDKHSDILIISEDLIREKDKRIYNGLKSTVKYQSPDGTVDLKMGERLWRTSFNDEEKRIEYPSGILEPGVFNFDAEDKISSTVGTNDGTLYEYDVSIGRNDTRYFKQMRNVSNVKNDTAVFGLTLGTDDITAINGNIYFNSKDITVFPDDRNGGKYGNLSLKWKDYTKNFYVTSSTKIFPRQNKYESFVARDGKERFNETKKVTATVLKVGDNNFSFTGDVISFNETVNNKGDEELGAKGSMNKKGNKNSDESIVTNGWKTVSEMLDWKNGGISSSRINIIESVNTPHPNDDFFKMDDNANMSWKSGSDEVIDSKEAVGLENADDSDDFDEKQIPESYTSANVSEVSDNKKNSPYKVNKKAGKDNVDSFLKTVGRKKGLGEVSTEYPLKKDSSRGSRLDNKQVDLSEISRFAGLKIFDDSEDIIRIQDTKRLVNSGDEINFNDSSKKFGTKNFRYRANIDMIDNDKNNDTGDVDLIPDEINFATTDEVSTSSGVDAEEASDYDTLVNVTDKIISVENVGVTETSNESVVSSKSYESSDALLIVEEKNDGEFDEDVGVSNDTTHDDVNFTTKSVFDQETTTIITHIKENGNAELEINNGYMSTDSDEEFANSKELKQTGRKRRVASGYLHLKRKDKYAKHKKLKKKNKLRKMYDKRHRNKKISYDHGALVGKKKTFEYKETTGLLETDISKKIEKTHTKELQVRTGTRGLHEIIVIGSNNSSYTTVNGIGETGRSEVVDSEPNTSFVKDNFRDASKTTKFEILNGNETNSSGYMNSTHETFDESSKNHTKYGYKILQHNETVTENTKEAWKKIDKNIYNKGLGVETTNAEVGIKSFSDSKSIQPDGEMNVVLSSGWNYDIDVEYRDNKDVENASSNFKTKFGNIQIDQDLESNVKSNARESKKRSIVLKRSVLNDDMKIDNNKDNPHSLSLEALRKINIKTSSETVIQSIDLGTLMNTHEAKNEPNIFSRSSVKRRTDTEDNLDNSNESGINSGSETLAEKNFQTSGNARIEKGRLSSGEMNSLERVANTDNIPAFVKSGRDEENVWPSNGGSTAEIGIIEQLPSLYGKLTFRDDFVFRDADGDPSSRISPLTVEAETSVIRCTKVMSPILVKCCRPLLEALYAVINDEKRPLDGPNLKRCNHFCYKAALKYCSPKAARITSLVIRKIKRYPLLGDVQFGSICNKTINTALNDCCDLLVLNFYQGNYKYEEKTFREP